MTISLSQQRMAQNQVVFRDANRRVQAGIDKANEVSKEDGVRPIDFDPGMSLRFICECSDETCMKRITIKLDEYNSIHESPKRFTIANGHEVSEIEDIVLKKPGYIIVEKYLVPAEGATVLKTTDLDNS